MHANEIAAFLNGELRGQAEREITRISTLSGADAHAIGFFTNPKYLQDLKTTQAGLVLLKPEHASACPVDMILVSNPYLCYARLSQKMYPLPQPAPQIHPTAVVDPSVNLGAGVYVGPYCVLEAGVVLGDGTQLVSHVHLSRGVRLGESCVIHPQVSVYHDCELGHRCLIHSGAVIGADGFGFAHNGEGWVKIRQIGRVVLGDEVEIGANTTIDRGAIEDTRIASGVKIDNLCMVGHNVRIAEHTAIAAATAIAGSAQIGAHCTLGGQVGVVGHIQIADKTHITGRTLVSHTIHRSGSYSSSTPMDETAQWRKNAARFRQLDKMARQLNRIEKALLPQAPQSTN
jgi:UDP-3-O-[3-hydroxymyristoyl] glucosamine N-acyltransferase